MSKRTVTARVERFPASGSFVISRGAKTHVDVVYVEVAAGGVTGRGEATPIYYHGETAEAAVATIDAVAPEIAGGASRDDLLGLLPRGCARNALDAALWDLEAKTVGKRVHELIGLPAPRPILTAFTISLGEPGHMEADARAALKYELLKLKLSGDGDLDRVAAVRRGNPHARLIVDANEAWTGRDVEREAAALVPYRVELIEQPVAAGQDHLLDGVRSPIPLCADETIHDRATLGDAVARYRFINIKLDKCGGLTEGLALAHAAKLRGIELMTGCMLSTSLGVAPAFMLGMQSQYADLDGPLLLAEDRAHAIRFEGSEMSPPERELWG
jgi:L-alanine-DL-glutamate epimerase-like enolase superfamily enzyme